MRVAILTISDSVNTGQFEDRSGPALKFECQARGWEVVRTAVLPDSESAIRDRLLADSAESPADSSIDIIFTTGGTGLGPRDVTPEATLAAAGRVVPGLAELMRRKGGETNPRAALSRGVAVLRGTTLILNLPGSPEGAIQSFYAVVDLLPHAVEVIHGARHDTSPDVRTAQPDR
jgi:molybdopterin adenylyltransferase